MAFSPVEHALKLEACRNRLSQVGKASSLENLTIIDAVHRLGTGHHFQDEIEQLLLKLYLLCRNEGFQGMNLHEVALCFRLLRQQGYFVPAGIFNKFKDSNGRFNQEFSNDIIGLIELYEASQLSIEGEEILDEAAEFSAFHLKARLERLDHSQARLVMKTLKHPYHTSPWRFLATDFFLSDFQGCESKCEWICLQQEVAKTDFNAIQSLHQKEIIQVSKWWKDLGLAEEWSFARDQPTKWYLESLVCLPDPSLSDQRIELTKSISLIYLIDDIFDLHGTLDELTLFTQVVNRWDYTDMDQLPDYMKTCFKTLCDITNEINHKVYKEHGWNPIDSLRKTWASLCNAFLVEAKWVASRELPKPDEYLKNGIISSGVHVVLVHTFFLLGLGFTKENVELLNNNPGIISSTASLFRLWDDLDEKQDGQDGSYVDCYMKEHQGVTVEDAREHVMQMISKAWKQLNKECLSPNLFPASFIKASLNIARMIPLMHSNDANPFLPSVEEYMKSVLYGGKTLTGNSNQ
ncbi:hypothetical protein SLA2020_481320 [Shorea laevis]